MGNYRERPVASKQQEELVRNKPIFVVVAMATWIPVASEKMTATNAAGCLAESYEKVMRARDQQINSSALFYEKIYHMSGVP